MSACRSSSSMEIVTVGDAPLAALHTIRVE